MGYIEIAWAVLPTLWALLLGIGVGLVAMGPSEFRNARILFLASPLPLIMVDIMWILTTDKPWWERAIISGLIGAAALIGLSESLRWINKKEGTASTSGTEIAAPTLDNTNV